MSECQWNKTSRVQKHYKPFKITSCFYAAIRAVDKRGTCPYNVQPKPKFWPTWPNEYRSSAKLRPNISVLRHVFDNTLHTLQFHQNTTLQLYNVYKKLRHIKLFSNTCFRAELNNLTMRLCMVCYQDGVHLITVINFSISFGRWGGMSTELQPNISVLWQVFDNTLNTLQFHQNTTLQLHNVYKKLYAEKVSDTKRQWKYTSSLYCFKAAIFCTVNETISPSETTSRSNDVLGDSSSSFRSRTTFLRLMLIAFWRFTCRASAPHWKQHLNTYISQTDTRYCKTDHPANW